MPEGASGQQSAHLVERLAFRAWPAAEVQECDGWRLRSTHGVTHRANSVWSCRAGYTLTLQQKIEAAEAFYAARANPTIFQLCPASQPPQLDDVLAERGYTRGRDTAVQVAPLNAVLDRAAGPEFDLTLIHTCDDRWLTVYGELAGVERNDLRWRGEIMRRIVPAAAYVVAWSGDTPCAVVSAVCEDGWLGVFNMATAAPYRRQGAARAVLRALALWAQERGATDIYLQVMRDNAPAWELYRRLGLTTLYGYHYRSLSLPLIEAKSTSPQRAKGRTPAPFACDTPGPRRIATPGRSLRSSGCAVIARNGRCAASLLLRRSVVEAPVNLGAPTHLYRPICAMR